MFSNADVVSRALTGDQRARLEWNGRFRSVLAGTARREFRMSPEDIEDLWQDLLLALLDRDGRQLRAYRRKAPLRSWLCAIWRHRCLDFKRRRSARVQPCMDSKEPVNVVCARFIGNAHACQALSLVGERDRLLLQLYFIQAWSQRDIATRLQAPENTVASRLLRAKVRFKRLASCLHVWITARL
jgi:RNA polymerase sigma factor (sigma-70 family)